MTTPPSTTAGTAAPGTGRSAPDGPGAGTPSLLYGEVEEELRQSVRGLLTARSAAGAVLARTESDEPYDAGVWRTLATEMGCAGLAVPESRGGAGASFTEAAVVAEEIGRAVAAVPFLGSAVVATAALLACGESELLGGLASGERTAALCVAFSTAPSAADFPAVAEVAGDVLTGAVTSVADALPATDLLVPARDGADAALYIVDARAVERTPAVSLDMTRMLCDVRLDAVAGRRVASGADAQAAVHAALRAGAALLASEQLGVAERCLEMTVEYVKARHQFGRPVGSFQALKHRLADLWVSVTQARSVARYAAACVASGHPDTDVAVAVAQALCSGVVVRAAEECVQMHGGIGFTWEHPAHLYLKRAKSTSIAFGTAYRHRAALAELVDLPPS